MKRHYTSYCRGNGQRPSLWQVCDIDEDRCKCDYAGSTQMGRIQLHSQPESPRSPFTPLSPASAPPTLSYFLLKIPLRPIQLLYLSVVQPTEAKRLSEALMAARRRQQACSHKTVKTSAGPSLVFALPLLHRRDANIHDRRNLHQSDHSLECRKGVRIYLGHL